MKRRWMSEGEQGTLKPGFSKLLVRNLAREKGRVIKATRASHTRLSIWSSHAQLSAPWNWTTMTFFGDQCQGDITYIGLGGLSPLYHGSPDQRQGVLKQLGFVQKQFGPIVVFFLFLFFFFWLAWVSPIVPSRNTPCLFRPSFPHGSHESSCFTSHRNITISHTTLQPVDKPPVMRSHPHDLLIVALCV